jgi:hypothetical protein
VDFGGLCLSNRFAVDRFRCNYETERGAVMVLMLLITIALVLYACYRLGCDPAPERRQPSLIVHEPEYVEPVRLRRRRRPNATS